MKKLFPALAAVLLFALSCSACSQQQKTQNSESAYEDTAETLNLDTLLEEMTAAATKTTTPQSSHYVLNTNTKRFHSPDCASVEEMEEKNKQEFDSSRDEVIAQGYQPCQRCHP